MLELENEGEFIEGHRFPCPECGFANVRLMEAGGMPAAQCTQCGMGFLPAEENR